MNAKAILRLYATRKRQAAQVEKKMIDMKSINRQ
jgi:hypothetical protein